MKNKWEKDLSYRELLKMQRFKDKNQLKKKNPKIEIDILNNEEKDEIQI